MPSPTYVPMANLTLSSSAASVTFSSISQAYRDLVLVYQVTFTSSGYLGWRLNGDAGSNYNWVSMHGNGSSAVSYSGSSETFGLTGLLIGTTTPVIGRLNFQDYSVTDKHKSVLVREDDSSTATSAMANRWASTAAVNTILLRPTSSMSFAAGSTFSLYGIAA